MRLEKMTEKMHGCDLSHWNKDIDWDNLSRDYEFVMLKIGGEEGKPGVFQVDTKFDEYYNECIKHDMYVGGYFFMSHNPKVINGNPTHIVYALDEFLKEGDYRFDMPIAIDVEKQGWDPKYIDKLSITAYVYSWCRTMEELGYYVTIYGSDTSTFKEMVHMKSLAEFDKWVARYGKTPEFVAAYGMWQYDNDTIDKNYCYIDYPSIIKSKGLNGWKKKEIAIKEQNLDELIYILQNVTNKLIEIKEKKL